MTAYKLKRLLLDMVYPNKCPFCGEIIRFDEYYHEECVNKLDFFDNRAKQTISVYEYNDKSKPFIAAIKENADGYAFAAAAKLISDIISVKIDLITCVPASKARMRGRGYNPPAMIAKELSAIMNLPCDVKMLVKTRETLVQKGLDSKERRENLKGAFEVNKKAKTANAVLVLDDVRATGSTLSEAAETLLAAGVKNVYTATIAASVITDGDYRS